MGADLSGFLHEIEGGLYIIDGVCRQRGGKKLYSVYFHFVLS
jgi:hypothetical protein